MRTGGESQRQPLYAIDSKDNLYDSSPGWLEEG